MRRKWMKFISLYLVIALLMSGCRFLFMGESKNMEDAPVIKNAEKVSDRYDLIVVGSDPEGISAAVSAARNGVKTLLISQSGNLGGLYTDGELNFIDIPETREGKVLVKGIYKEFFDGVGGSGYDINKAKCVFYDMVKKEKNITLRVSSEFIKPIMEGSVIKGVVVKEDGREASYFAPLIIDATQDGDVAEAAGATYTYAGEDIGEKDRQMGVTLVFGLKNLDWEKIKAHLTIKRAKGELTEGSTDMGAKGNTAWGYTKEGYRYQTVDPAMRLRGFNMSRQSDGTVLFNALIVFDVDPLNKESREKGIERGKKELEHIIPYLKENCVGFKDAELAGVAKDLYVRESRHINCEYMLTIDDVLENRSHWDGICVTNYPVDVQPTKKQRFGTVVGFPDQYMIPFRSLVPLKIDNIMIVGRSAGYRSMAAGSARIVPTGMACGEAAGVAASICLKQKINPRQLAKSKSEIELLRKTLIEKGASLTHEQVIEPVMKHWAYSGLKTLRAMGFIDGGYDNNYHLDEVLSKNAYQNILNNTLRKAGFPPNPVIQVNDNPPIRQVIGTIGRVVGERKGIKYPNDDQTYKQVLVRENILTPDLLPYFSDMNKQPKRAEVIMLVANLYHWLEKQPNAAHYTAITTMNNNEF